MAMNDDDTLTRWPRHRMPSTSEIIANPKAFLPEQYRVSAAGQPGDQGTDTQAPPKKSDPLPRPGDAYRAHARFLSQLDGDPSLIHFVRGDFSCEGFRYSDLRRLRWLPSGDPGQGPTLLLRFVEAEITDVTIEGRHLEDTHHWIGEGSMPWVWEQPPVVKTRDDTATVITRITISEARGRMSGNG